MLDNHAIYRARRGEPRPPVELVLGGNSGAAALRWLIHVLAEHVLTSS